MSANSGGARRRLLAGTALAASLLLPSLAQAQTWTGGTDYNTAGNWTPANVPDSAGEAATFRRYRHPVGGGVSPVSPQSWTFATNAQDFAISGAAVTFGTGVTNNASAAQAISIANNMTGTTLSQAAASTLTLSGTNSFTNTSVSAGTLVNNGALTSSVTNTGTFNNNATVTGTLTNNAGTTTNAGSISGRATIGGGSVLLTGSGSVRDVRFTANSGMFDISNTTSGATIGALFAFGGFTGTVELGAKRLTFGQATALFGFGGTIQGSGGVTVDTGGFLSLTAANTYTGATIAQGGTLLLRSPNDPNTIAASSVLNITSAAASVSVVFDSNIRTLQGIAGSTLQNDATLTITNASTVFDGVIVDLFNNSSNLTLLSGHQTLNGINTYKGNTTVNGGTLTVNGSIATSFVVTVFAGGTLDGSGIVGNTTINGGTLSPGNGIGTMTVQRSLHLHCGRDLHGANLADQCRPRQCQRARRPWAAPQ